MKWMLLLLPLLFAMPALAQQKVTGMVTDKETGLPVPGATIRTQYASTTSNADGIFTLQSIKYADTARISFVGYQPYHLTIGNFKDTIHIRLIPGSVVLNQVTISGHKNYRRDSLRNRAEFASVFNYEGTEAKDVMISNAHLKYVPYDNITAENNTTALVSFNMLSLVSLLEKNKDNTTKLQKELLRDERTGYVDQAFSRQRIIAVTGLRGDSLETFMDRYRPTPAQVKKMTDYQVLQYIQKSCADFRAGKKVKTSRR